MNAIAILRKPVTQTKVIHNHTPENIVCDESGGWHFNGEPWDDIKVEYYYRGCGCPVEFEPQTSDEKLI